MNQQEWQPIETAPRDGSKFLAYRPLAENSSDPVMKVVCGLPNDGGCWAKTVPPGYDDTNFTDGSCKATHWMPLPPPPITHTAR
jgi:hypothetical protein